MEYKNTGATDEQIKVNKTVLVVDDSEMMCFLVKSILENKYKIVIKSDGEDALTYLIEGNRPNLILLDMLMPKMNGRIFVRRVQADPRIGKIPIIFITSVDSVLLMNSFKAKGVDYITKPFVDEDLLKKVNDILK